MEKLLWLYHRRTIGENKRHSMYSTTAHSWDRYKSPCRPMAVAKDTELGLD
jgi:hypothetical protein